MRSGVSPLCRVNIMSDWLQVAAEEALHFSLLAAHLRKQGFDYGDFPAHNSLWDMAEKTRATSLPASPWCRARWRRAASMLRRRCAPSWRRRAIIAAAEILDIILRDEIGHVAIGNRWYGWLCEEAGWNRSRLMLRWQCNTRRRPCAGRSIWKRAGQPGLVSWNWPHGTVKMHAASLLSLGAVVPQSLSLNRHALRTALRKQGFRVGAIQEFVVIRGVIRFESL